MKSQIFDKISVLILSVCFRLISTTSECTLKTIMCSEILVTEGFRYEHECPQGSEYSVEGNDKMNFGSADLREQVFNFVSPVVKMDNHSVITDDCQDLNITCTRFTENLKKLAGEKCVNFKSIPASQEEKFPPGNLSVSPPPPTQGQSNLTWTAALVILLVVILLVVYGLISYYCWKKHKEGGIFKCLQRNQEGSGFPMVPGGDVEGQNNADVRNGEDPRGCGESDRDALQSAVSCRNMNEEPGGTNGTKGGGNKRELHGGGAAAHHHAEEQPLLPDQRAANGDFNRFSEDVAIVNELSSNQDPVSRPSATPNADVESTHPEKTTN
ncbi:uncharacterized protein LOC103468774 isoform X2 [Poecilia reticulata]|uniref:uncharacterized protein LOC103468774 isoform X2 n=1 Tax=Poecilia reticulata TaxID=8081 RepID=UPI0004A4FD40|nr:PREDICTED: uncharacterized protein LOC103468774 isoform X2 [Poecilia reticulata]